MHIIKITRKGIFPIRKLQVEVNGILCHLKGNESAEIDLPPSEYAIDLKMDWWKSKKFVKISEATTKIVITHRFSDFFFWIGLLIISGLAIATFFSKLNPLILSSVVLVFIFSQLLSIFINKDGYFKCASE